MEKPRRTRSRGASIALRGVRRITGGVQAVEPREEKALPNADTKFAKRAESFASIIAKDPARFNISDVDADQLKRRVKRFLAALSQARNPGFRTVTTIREKNDTRKELDEFLRVIRNQIRGDGFIDRCDKVVLGIHDRPKKLRKCACPISPPVLRYLCGIDGEGSAPGVHVLDFHELNREGTAQKPKGAASLHVYFDLVRPGDPTPQHPAERGWPKFLREFTRSPMKIEFPRSMSGPMLVVYWGRWSDGKGNTGPWSEPCVARIEGTLAVAELPEGAVANGQRMVFIQPPRQLMGAVEGESDAASQTNRAIAAMMESVPRALEAATVRLLNAA